MNIDTCTILHFPGTEEEQEDFRKFLVHATAHTKYENMYILITKKKLETHFVDHDVMDKLKERLNGALDSIKKKQEDDKK